MYSCLTNNFGINQKDSYGIKIVLVTYLCAPIPKFFQKKITITKALLSREITSYKPNSNDQMHFETHVTNALFKRSPFIVFVEFLDAT